ncbi:hypothetical protein BC936DRAFT_141199 [Jimgerdemannia flammicorona]|uniref:BTB domain-containing protein n=1 Tax=Jimgerdemannia flammicorona TaxID=994334 RepID=A0A433A2Q1_9FUNG|nr:hypothetical protein BC936DRAFT_141199 [Jimgerdemannia flammicorona]
MGKLMPDAPPQRPSKRPINRSQSTYTSFQSRLLPTPKPRPSTSSSAYRITKTTFTQVSFLCQKEGREEGWALTRSFVVLVNHKALDDLGPKPVLQDISSYKFLTSFFAYLPNQDGIKVKANKTLLASRHDYFRSLLDSNFREANLQEITLPFVTSTVFRVILEYIITGRFLKDIITPANVLEVYEAAQFFLLSELEKDVVKLAERTFAPTRVKLVSLLSSITDEFDTEEQYPTELLSPLVNKLFFLLRPWQPGTFSGLSPAALKLVLRKLPDQWMVNENLLAGHLLLWALEHSVQEVAEEGVLRLQEVKFCSEKVIDYCFETGFYKSQFKPGSLPMDIMEILPNSARQLKSTITSAPMPRIPLTRKMWAPILKHARDAISAVAPFVTWNRVHPNLLLFLKHTGVFSADMLQDAHNNIQAHLQEQLQHQAPRTQAPTPTLTRQNHGRHNLNRFGHLNQFNRIRPAASTASTIGTITRVASTASVAPMAGFTTCTRAGNPMMGGNNSIIHPLRHPLRSLIWESVQFSNNYSIVEDYCTLTAPWQEPVVVFTSTPFPAYGQYSWSFLVEKGCKCHSDIWIGLLAGPALTRAKIKANTLALNARTTGYAFGCQGVLHPVR